MDKSAGITSINAVEMLDVDDGAVLITTVTCSEDKSFVEQQPEVRPNTGNFTRLSDSKKHACDFAAILTEKQKLIELLRGERDAARTELENIRHKLEVAQNNARIELQTVREAAIAKLKKQQDEARDELENVRKGSLKMNTVIFNVRYV